MVGQSVVVEVSLLGAAAPLIHSCDTVFMDLLSVTLQIIRFKESKKKSSLSLYKFSILFHICQNIHLIDIFINKKIFCIKL